MYFSKTINVAKITQEIQASSITIALDHINSSGSACDIFFKADLSVDDTTTLNRIVDAHVPAPILDIALPFVHVASIPSIGSKNIVVSGGTKKLFARYVGIQQALMSGSNEISYTGTFPWVKLVGIEVINSEALDTVLFRMYDNENGSFSGTPNALLNQFAYSINLPKDFYSRIAQFDADFYASMVVKITYNSISNKTVGINFLMNEVK